MIQVPAGQTPIAIHPDVMRTMPQHLAGSTGYLRVHFVDRNDAPAAPSSATYSIVNS